MVVDATGDIPLKLMRESRAALAIARGTTTSDAIASDLERARQLMMPWPGAWGVWRTGRPPDSPRRSSITVGLHGQRSDTCVELAKRADPSFRRDVAQPFVYALDLTVARIMLNI